MLTLLMCIVKYTSTGDFHRLFFFSEFPNGNSNRIAGQIMYLSATQGSCKNLER